MDVSWAEGVFDCAMIHSLPYAFGVGADCRSLCVSYGCGCALVRCFACCLLYYFYCCQ